MKNIKKTILIILDGFGLAKPGPGNAIELANLTYYKSLLKKYPHAKLKASGESVGVPKRQMGNSEVGHLHIGTGRLIEQDLLKINKSIKNKSFFKNKILKTTMRNLKKKGTALHLMGLLSDGGVHSHIKHLFALLKMAKKEGVKRVYVHAFLDGRDTAQKSAKKYIIQTEKLMKELNLGHIATISGRFYGMDRDNRWNRSKKAYEVIVDGKCFLAKSAVEAINIAYRRGETDEFVQPTLIHPEGTVENNDTVIFFNFRSDRAREITRSFIDKKFKKFKRTFRKNLTFVSLTHYDDILKTKVVFPPVFPKNTLGKIISKNNLLQLRLAETEKYAHVTFFFNGLSGKIFKGEKRILIPSPKVLTYDLKPEMSAFKIKDVAKREIVKNKYSFILINFANADMVGHSGKIKPTIKALKVIDKCLNEIIKTARKNEYSIIITADHGNAECKLDKNKPHTAHTTNPVPLIIISDKKIKIKKEGSLQNIAPTVLDLMNLKKPIEMNESMIK